MFAHHAELNILLLHRYLYYYENRNPIIHVRYLSGLIALINEQNAAGDNGAPALSSAVEAHFNNTLGESCFVCSVVLLIAERILVQCSFCMCFLFSF